MGATVHRSRARPVPRLRSSLPEYEATAKRLLRSLAALHRDLWKLGARPGEA